MSKPTDSEHSDHRADSPLNQKGFGITLIVFLTLLVAIGVFLFMDTRNTPMTRLSYTEFITLVKQQRVSVVHIIDGSEIRGEARLDTGGSSNRSLLFVTIIPYQDETLIPLLQQYGVPTSGSRSNTTLWSRVLDFAPLVVFIVFMLLMYRLYDSRHTRDKQFGRSRAHLYKGVSKATFADVAGLEEAKRELAEVVSFLKNPKKYVDMGAKIPTGVLLVGSPGTGKTLLARAVAGEAGVSFLHISGSDFVEMFVGVGASRVRDLFTQARKMAPSIIFIDEIDAVGRSRSAGGGGAHDEREQTLNQMLVEMDGFDNKAGVIVLAATNRPDVLDTALLRPGRFDRQVYVSLPDIKERRAILEVHAKKIKLAGGVDLQRFARASSGMSGADLANMVNEAALFAAEKDLSEVGTIEFEKARDKILMGIARETMVIPEKEKRMTAVHEAGHALPYYYLEHVSPLHKVTIIPRGRALGLTVSLPLEDSYSYTRTWFQDQLVVLFGGYAAETLIYGDTTTGAQNDIQRATAIARRMVCEWGMSEAIGAIHYAPDDDAAVRAHDVYSDATAAKIDAAVKTILDTARAQSTALLKKHRKRLTTLADHLFENETMSDEEIRVLLDFPPVPAEES